MAPKRGDRSRKKKVDVRFIVLDPKPSGRMKLPDRLFRPEGAGPARNFRAKARPLESPLPNLSLSRRIIATMIAAIFICTGLWVMILGVRNEKWLLVLLGPFSISYGIAWVWVAHDGRLPGGRLRLNPWNWG